MKRVLVAAAVLAGVVFSASPALAAPGTAERSSAQQAPVSPFASVPATGTVTHITSGLVTQVASLRIQRFAVQDGKLVAIAAVRDATGQLLGTAPIPVQNVNVARGSSAMSFQQASCRILHLELGPLDLNLLGLRIQLNRVVLDITAERGPGNLLGNLLCAIAGLLNGNPTAGLVALLNRVLGINGTNPFANVPATGTATRGTTVTQIASANVLRFAARRGRLFAITQLRDTAGTVLATVPIRVLQPNASFMQRPSCRILHLDLAPIDLNLLGLRIRTSRIVLDITAEPGPGNLLGNLLCGIANLLNRNSAGAPAIANRLNRAIRLFA